MIRARQADDIRPAAIGRDIMNAIQIDDVATMAAEEHRRIEPRLGFGQRIRCVVAAAVGRIDGSAAILALNQQDIRPAG